QGRPTNRRCRATWSVRLSGHETGDRSRRRGLSRTGDSRERTDVPGCRGSTYHRGRGGAAAEAAAELNSKDPSVYVARSRTNVQRWTLDSERENVNNRARNGE